MLDIFNIPSNTENTKVFYAISGSNSWQTWQKPRNAKFIQIFCLGGGASGGGGVRGTAGSPRAGAGGGGSGGVVRALFPAFLLPDMLYVQPGAGGAAQPAIAAGNPGGISYVSLAPATTAVNVIVQSSNAGAVGGASVGSSNINAGGAAATQWTAASNPFVALAITSSAAGIAGGASTNANTGVITNLQALSQSIVTGGAGGGSNNSFVTANPTASAGGSILSASVILTSNVAGGLTGSLIGPGNPGGHGYGSLIPFCGTGGAGGSGQASGSFAAGRGGDGWYGCGGGGGGTAATTAGSTNGGGGKGGDGLVIITTIF